MTIYELQNLFAQYGIYVLAALVLWNYLSLPVVPGGAVLVLMGVMAGLGIFSLQSGLLAAVLASIIGSLVIYAVGYLFPRPLMKFYSRRKKLDERFRLVDKFMTQHGRMALLRCRLNVTFRTFISIPAGILRMNMLGFLLSTVVGNALFCGAVVGACYLITALLV